LSTDLPVAYAGEPGAFAEDAVIAFFGERQRVGVPGFAEVFEAVTDGAAGAGVVPIENLVSGTVHEVHDLLLANELVITAEVVVPVELVLAALPGQELAEIDRVYSHVQALGQAQRFLRGRSWTLLTTYNTAGAGKLIADKQELHSAAVLSPRAAGRFGLEVLAPAIQDQADNRTRFLVVQGATPGAASPGERDGASRTTVAFGVRNEPGTLLRALRAFADRNVNLSRLESRPSRAAAWEYVFWVDIDADATDPTCAAAIEALRSEAQMVRILGSYAQAPED